MRRISRLLVLPLVAAGLDGCCRPACRPCPSRPPSLPAPRAASERRPEPGKPIAVSGEGYEGAIFARGWAPSDADVRRLEAAFPAAFRAAVTAHGRPLSEYFRQYVGVLDRGQDRRIHVHGIHRDALHDSQRDVRKDERLVADGGDSYFDAVYDPESDEFARIGLHGDA